MEEKGYTVKADLPEHNKPPTFECGCERFKPDIWAKKGEEKIIIEVETPGSVKSDENQRACFQKSADKSKNTTFEWKVIEKDKNG